MDVRLSAEQRALRDSVARVVNSLAPASVRDLEDLQRSGKLDAAVVASGWRELRASADSGDDPAAAAPLASAVEAALVAEELGRGLADTPFLGPTLAAELRRLAGAPASMSPETVAFVPGLTAPACADDGALTLPSVAIDARGSSAALVLVPARDGYRLGRAAVPDAGTSADLTRPAALAGPAPLEAVHGQRKPITRDALGQWTSLGLALTSADLVGIMRGALRLACEHAKARRQFGVAIGSFQAIQHRLADALTALEGARSIALAAAWAVDALPADEAMAKAAMAKAYCSRAARAVCEAAIQVHGGIGNTWECQAHLYLRRSIVSTDILGGTGANLERALEHHGIRAAHGLR
jgi:hypothetical protein